MSRPQWGVAAVVSLLLWSALLGVGSRVASADPGPEFEVPTALATEPVLPAYAECPEALDGEPLASEDAAAVQVYELRRDERQSCLAVVERLDQVVARQWWIVSQLLGQQDRLKALDERAERVEPQVGEIREELTFTRSVLEGTVKAQLVGVDAENPLPVTSGGGGGLESAELVSSIDAGAETTTAALYLLAGLLVSLFIGYCLWRLVSNAA